jgi:methionyl-tRNA formyltransferase
MESGGAGGHAVAGKYQDEPRAEQDDARCRMTGMDGLNIVFMGTPAFVVPVLDAVLRSADAMGGRVIAVYAAPDRPAGRGRQVRRSPVRERADALGIDVYTPERVTNPTEKARFEELGSNLVVLAAYGLLLPSPFLYSPAHGAVNVHPSLLPRHRGASPVAAAILEGDTVTGTSIIKMNEGLDTGDLLMQRRVELAGDERVPELTKRLFILGGDLLGEALSAYTRGELAPTPQPEEGVTVIKRFVKTDGDLDWSKPAVVLERQVRAFDPWPGSATTWGGKRLEVVASAVSTEIAAGAPGTVVASGGGAAVVTSSGLLVLERVKLEGRQETGVAEFVRGHPGFVGAALPS